MALLDGGSNLSRHERFQARTYCLVCVLIAEVVIARVVHSLQHHD